MRLIDGLMYSESMQLVTFNGVQHLDEPSPLYYTQAQALEVAKSKAGEWMAIPVRGEQDAEDEINDFMWWNDAED